MIKYVGGSEFVYSKRIQKIALGSLIACDFSIESEAMDYGFSIDGILGMDFLTSIKAIVDLDTLEVRSSNVQPAC
ncbi:hypothetical protein [Neomoorella mulderi]|uniref:Uncharacterized protein n=1 Tax=Moorella mulderi DSM 14980 TaxID=1122241 RepID=A0A151AXN7_9FIRM|nr:hypothetical protein [Moorella mulderi]KYH32313.1 hypothetical protein MOMUL_15350 [Moorella mulderi DSM 14980]